MAQVVEQIDVTGNLTRQVALAQVPLSPTEVAVDPVGGPAQVYGMDFTVAGNLLMWSIAGSDIMRVVEDPRNFTVILRVIYEA